MSLDLQTAQHLEAAAHSRHLELDSRTRTLSTSSWAAGPSAITPNPAFTKDLDVFIGPSSENLEAVVRTP